MWYYGGSAWTASGCRVDLIKRNGETDRTKYKFTPELIKIFNCFCWNVNNNKSMLRIMSIIMIMIMIILMIVIIVAVVIIIVIK